MNADEIVAFAGMIERYRATYPGELAKARFDWQSPRDDEDDYLTGIRSKMRSDARKLQDASLEALNTNDSFCGGWDCRLCPFGDDAPLRSVAEGCGSRNRFERLALLFAMLDTNPRVQPPLFPEEDHS